MKSVVHQSREVAKPSQAPSRTVGICWYVGVVRNGVHTEGYDTTYSLFRHRKAYQTITELVKIALFSFVISDYTKSSCRVGPHICGGRTDGRTDPSTLVEARRPSMKIHVGGRDSKLPARPSFVRHNIMMCRPQPSTLAADRQTADLQRSPSSR